MFKESMRAMQQEFRDDVELRLIHKEVMSLRHQTASNARSATVVANMLVAALSISAATLSTKLSVLISAATWKFLCYCRCKCLWSANKSKKAMLILSG